VISPESIIEEICKTDKNRIVIRLKKILKGFFMKKIIGFLVLALLFVSLSAPVPVSADPAPGGPFESVLRLQNMGTATASVTYTFYDSTGAVAYSASTTVPVDDIVSIYVPSISALASGEYSVVVSSSQPLASLSIFGDGDSSAAYTGFDQGATDWFIPGLYDNYYSYYSNVYVQNVSGSPVNVTIELFRPGNSTPVYTDTASAVPSYATVKFDQAGLSQLNDNVAYSAKVSSSGGDIVAIANIYGSGSTASQLYSYNGYPTGGTTWYTPVLMKNYYGWNAAIAIQNTSETASANVDVHYNTGLTKSYTIQALSAITIYVPNEASLPSGTTGLFSAKIVSNDEDIVVMVNESNSYNRAATYNGFASGTTTVNAPSVKKEVSNFSTSVTCQNIGTSPTTMTIAYFGNPAGSTSPSIAAGGTYIWYQPNETLPAGYDGSAVITSGGQSIACIINQNMEASPYNTQSMDMLSSYNGVNE
jgi:hypothetical protein